MKSNTLKPFWFVVAVFLGVGAIVSVVRLRAPKELVPWRTDFRVAQEEAMREKKPLLVYFSASWCVPCDRLKRTTWADAAVEQALGKFVPVQVDFDRNAELAARFDADVLPSFSVVDPDGRTVKSAAGYMSAQEFLLWLGT